MEADIENPSQVNRFHVDGVHKTKVVEWSKKRKLQSDQLDLRGPKHKCWVGNSSFEHTLTFDENTVLDSMHIHVIKGRTDAALLDDTSELESAKDSNSFTEYSNAAMSINEEGKLGADSAKTYLYGRPSSSFVDWGGYNVKDHHCTLDVSTVEEVSFSEEDALVDHNEYSPSYHFADLHALKNLEEHILKLGSGADHMYIEYAKGSIVKSIDKEFEDIFYSKGENPNLYVLPSGRWNVNQEAQSSTRPPTIDQEFEQYFSMLMV